MAKLPLVLLGMLWASGAFAVSYSVSPHTDDELCRSFRNVLAQGLVPDARRPLCERKFELSPGAESFGFTPIKKTLLPRVDYPALMLRLMKVGESPAEASSATKDERDKKLIARNLATRTDYIYVSHFDGDNSGRVRKVFIWETPWCTLHRGAPDDVSTFIENNDGSLDPTWGVGTSTEGIPVIYKHHTYYVLWQSSKGSMIKDELAQLDVYDAFPFKPENRGIIPHAVLSPSYCTVYQNE